MRTERQHQIDRAVIRSVRDCGGRLIAEAGLHTSVEIKVDFLRPTSAEISESIRHAERELRILGVSGETGRKYKITEAGEAWAMEHNL